MARLLCLVAAILLLAGCAELAPSHSVVDSLYFGTNTQHGQVSAKSWRNFLDTVVTPRFPKGFTTWSAAGQWRNHAGHIEQEKSYVLQIVHPPSRRDDMAVAEIVATYKKQFEQEAVLRTRTAVLLSF